MLSIPRVCAKSLQSCPTLCNPIDCSPPGSSVHGILQARILEWLSSGQWNLGGNDLHHFWAWPIKPSTGSSALSLPHLLTRFEQFQIPCFEGSRASISLSLRWTLWNRMYLLLIQTHSTTSINFTPC